MRLKLGGYDNINGTMKEIIYMRAIICLVGVKSKYLTNITSVVKSDRIIFLSF